MTRYRRTESRQDSFFGENFDDYPHWQKGYEFEGIHFGDHIQDEHGRIHVADKCEEIKNEQ